MRMKFFQHTSTLWILLEIHEHPLVMLNQDRTVNISCTGWSHSPIDSSHHSADNHQQKNHFRLAIVSPNGTANSPVGIVFLGTEYNLSVQTVQPVEWSNIFVHSCSAISVDKKTNVPLIDSDGCSMDQRLITDFHQSNRLLRNGISLTTTPLITSSGQKNLPTQNSTTVNQKLSIVTVATAKIPQMFRFNTQFDQRRVNVGSVIHFECTVERCEERTGKTPTAIAPCPRTNCDRKRTIAEKEHSQQQQSVITSASSAAEQLHHDHEDAVDEHGGKRPAAEELELVTQLLRAQQDEEGEEEEREDEFGGEETEEGSPTQTTMGAKQQNGTERPAEEGQEDGEGAEAKGRGKAVVNKTTATAAVSGEVKQQPNQHLQLVQRPMKQMQMVRNVVRVFETQRNVRDGTVLHVPKMSEKNGDTETKKKDTTENASQPTSTSQYADSYTLDHNPLFINDSTEFDIISPTEMPSYSSSNSSSSPQGPPPVPPPADASPSSPSSFPPPLPHQHCVSMDQLSRLYMLGIALCALFLFGCLFNLLMCCLGRKRTVPSGGGDGTLQMPFRAKRGRRQPQQQQKTNTVGGHSSHTTLTSSLYGGGTVNETKNGGIGNKAPQQVGFWINEDGQRNGGGTIEYAPMVSSFYEGVPNATDAANNVSKRRLSVHSYASVKQRGNSQLLCKVPMPTNNGSSTMVVQQPHNQHVNQQLSMSPSSYSPSTTASSSTSGGGGGGGGAIGPLLHDMAAQQQHNHQQQLQQQQQYPPLLHNPGTNAAAIMRSTFHPPTIGGEQQQQQSNSSVASSVRSSTTLDGGGPSCSQSSIGDESDNFVGGTTPRPSVIGEFGTIQHHQQYHMNNNTGTNMSSTFRCPTAESKAMLMMNSEHLNESFSIL